MDVEMPDGTVISGVPEGTTKSELMRRLQKMQGGGSGSQAGNMRGDMPPLGSKTVGRTSEGRPIIQNPDGSFSTERTTTIEIDGRFVNIPTIFGGKEVSPDRAAAIMRKNDFVDPETGRRMQFFDTMDLAVRAAEQRSKSLAGEMPDTRNRSTEPAPIPEPVIPNLAMRAPPTMGESVGRGAVTRFIGNLLGLPDAAATLAANAATTLTPRGDKPFPGPLEAIAHGLNFATGGRLDPIAAAESLRAQTPEIGERVIPGIPTGSEAASVPEAALDTGLDVARGGPVGDFGTRMEIAQERTAEAEERNPGSFATGEIGGDIATLMLGRPARSKLRALESRRAVLPQSKLAPGIRRQLDDIVRSKFGRALERTGIRAGEAGLEGAVLAVLDEGDPVKTAALAAGGQTMGTMVLGLNKAIVGGGGLTSKAIRSAASVFTAGALIQLLKEKFPGGRNFILESLEDGAGAVALTMALGGTAAIAGLDRKGGRFAENLPRFADALTAIPRGALVSGAKDLMKAMQDDDGTVERAIMEMVKDTDAFGPEMRRRIDRAFRNGNLGKELERLKNDPRIRNKLDEISP